MRAFLLAAGLGTRLRPMTLHTPKPLVDVGGEALLFRAVRQLRAAGVREMGVNLFHLGGQIRDALGDGHQFGVDVTYFDETPHILGTGAFLLVNSDVWHDFDLSEVVRVHKANALATMVVHRMPRRPELHNVWAQAPPSARATAPLGFAMPIPGGPLVPRIGHPHVQTGRIRSIAGAPVPPAPTDVATIYTGVAVFNTELLTWLPDASKQSGLVTHGLIPAMAAGREVRFYEPAGTWFDCGTQAEVLRASTYALRVRAGAGNLLEREQDLRRPDLDLVAVFQEHLVDALPVDQHAVR
jgi:NDP-sugar pyrophosphorylase family protein